MPPSPDNKAIARKATEVFGGPARVNRYWDDNHERDVAILSAEGSPRKGVTSWATIGLSDRPLELDGRELGFGVELVGACDARGEVFGNVLATAAFCILNSDWFVGPGVIFPDVVGMYERKSAMQHLLFVPPFLWDDGFETLDLATKKVTWLLAVPISENEMRLAEESGVPALEELLETHQIDIFDLGRPSIL